MDCAAHLTTEFTTTHRDLDTVSCSDDHCNRFPNAYLDSNANRFSQRDRNSHIDGHSYTDKYAIIQL